MFVNKIQNISFNGYQRCIGNAGEHLYKFNYPHSEQQKVEVRIYKLDSDTNAEPLKTIELDNKTNTINFDEISDLKQDENIRAITYVNGNPVEDRVITRKGTFPLIQGQAILTMPDIHRAGAKYSDFKSDKTGSIIYDTDKQKAAENVIRTFSNISGGSMAGLEYDLDMLSKIGIKKIFMTPIWGQDDRSSHRYWNKNDMQISDDIGNIDNYENLIRKLFKNGMQYVDDFAITSEGLEGIHIQYILRWAGQNPDTQYLFKLSGLKDAPLTLGVVPRNKENLRHKVINPSVIYDPEKKAVVKNPEYDSNKETYFQIYDASQVTEEQVTSKNTIKHYENLASDNKLKINTSDDTIMNYVFEIKPEEYEQRLNEFVKMNKSAESPMELNSPEGTLFIGQFTHFKIGTNAEGAVFWDANKDLLKRNYYISGYDEKLLNAIPNLSERSKTRELMQRGTCMARDMAVQAGVYRAQTVKDAQMLYIAQNINNEIGSIPTEALLNDEEIQNVSDGWYNLAQKGIDNKDDITLRAVMKLPLDSLELGDNTVGVLSSPYFSKRAVSEDGIGLSRYEFFKNGAGLYSPYCSVYHNVDNLFENQITEFVNDVIVKVNESSSEKLLDENKKYTEYGEYVVDLIGKDIAKYALLKAIAGDKLQAKVMSDDIMRGKITYNYPELREATTLKALGIKASNPTDEAQALYSIIQQGLDNLKNSDVDFVAQAISKRIEGTTTSSFRLSEAMVNKAGLGLDFRLDASKDVADMDAVRNGDMTFDQAWDQVIDFWKKAVGEIKEVNPNAYIVAEITDVDQLMRAQYGNNTDVWNADLSEVGGKYKNVPDAIKRFFEETGITSEAGYSYTFTDLLHVFSADGEYGNMVENPMESFKQRIETLIADKNLDYIRNLWTFADNQDKPSILHVMALDMELFHTNNLEPDFRDKAEKFNDDSYEKRRRNARISILKELTNSDKFEDLPLEAMMNLDNKDYFRTSSPRAVAMSKLIREAISTANINSNTAKDLKEALVDLTNGNYLKDAPNVNLNTIDIPELQSLENALNYILQKSGLSLDDTTKTLIIDNAKKQAMIEKYAIRGDYDWKNGDGSNHWAAEELQNRTKTVLANNEWDFMQYSPYVASVAALLFDSYKTVVGENASNMFLDGTREFVHNFKRQMVQEHTSGLPYTEDSQTAMNKKAYAARDIETVIEMLIQQAEYKTGKEISQTEKDHIMAGLFELTTKNAADKALMYASFLSALPGIPSQFYRDIFGALGYDEKAKNMFLQNRNAVRYSELENDGPLKKYRNELFEKFKEVLQIRNRKGLEALNNGTPYMLETHDKNIISLLYQGDGDDAVITILNGTDINRKSGVNESTTQSEIELDEILLPAAIALPTGMKFIQSTKSGDLDIEYIIDKGRRLIRQDGKKISINTENGTAFLKRAGKLAFRGRNVNKQYNFSSNLYQKNEINSVGENLSIIAK